MLKKTYALGLLAAATLGCFLTPAAHASQVEVNKQTAEQNAAAVGTGNTVFQDLDQGSYQNQLNYPRSSGYYHPQPATPQVQISDQTAEQNAAAVGTGNTVFQDLDQSNIQKQFGF
jgi:hypothetical protein